MGKNHATFKNQVAVVAGATGAAYASDCIWEV